MIIEMGKLAAEQLNYFPVKGGVSPHYSPHMTLDGLNLDYEKHCQCNFGAYVQAFAESPDACNSQAPCTIDAIYLRPLPGLTNGHRVMNLATGLPLTCTKVTELPVTEHVIKSVENLAKEQDIKIIENYWQE